MVLPPIYQAPIDGLEKAAPLKVQKIYRAFIPEKAQKEITADERRKKRDRRQKALPVAADRRRNDRRKQDTLKQRLQQSRKRPDPDDKLGQNIDETV